MLLKFFVLAALTQALPSRPLRRSCGSRNYVQELDQDTETDVAEAIADGNVDEEFGSPPTVLVNFHSIMSLNGLGNVTDKQVCD
jgi:hypothetical protein